MDLLNLLLKLCLILLSLLRGNITCDSVPIRNIWYQGYNLKYYKVF